MPTKVNLRQVKGSTLTIPEADESLEHLSNHEQTTAGQQLHSGGQYNVAATMSCILPTDGNEFSINVSTGTLTLTGGTVEGVTNETVNEPGLRTYWRIAGDWKLMASGGDQSSSEYTVVTGATTATLANPYIWINTGAADVNYTVPAGFPVGTTLNVVKSGQGNVVFLTQGTEGVVNPVTNTNDLSGATINESNRVVTFIKIAADRWGIGKD